LQEAESRSEDSDDPDGYRWDSDNSIASSSRRRHAPKASKKRMSILTNQYYDIPSYENGFEYAIPDKPESRRRFFQSVARWDTRYQRVVVPGREVSPIPKSLYSRHEPRPAVVTSGARYFDDEEFGDEEEEDVGSMEDDEEATSDTPETESGDVDEISVMLE
jgi:histone deacetylase 1/2